MPEINRDFELADLRAELGAARVAECVLVQVLNVEDETREYLEVASSSPVVAGVVGWADLTAAGLRARVAQLRHAPAGEMLVGIRHQAQAEPDPGAWLRSMATGSGLASLEDAGLVFELMLRPAQLADAAAVVAAYPRVTFVLDHAGKPPIASGWRSTAAREWASQLRVLATRPNLVCKLSGLTTMARLPGWSVDDLRPFTDLVLECFGAGRVIFGSDWPVSMRAAPYRRTVETVKMLLAALSEPERTQVMGGTARRVYRLRSMGSSSAGRPVA
jgi:L-fuconolactonase